MNYWDISEEFLKIPPCLDQMHVQVAEIGKKKVAEIGKKNKTAILF